MGSALTGGLGILAGFSAIGAVKSIAQASLQMDGFERSLKFVTGSAAGAQREIKFLQSEAQRLGTAFAPSVQEFTKLAAAAKLSGQSMSLARATFTAVSESASVLNLTTEETALIFKALGQIMSKGRVMSEELVGQLGEALPGALGLTAEGMGVTTQKLRDMMVSGLDAKDFFNTFIPILHDTMGKDAVAAGDSAAASFHRFDNAVFELKNTIADAGFMSMLTGQTKIATGQIVALAGAIKDLRAIWGEFGSDSTGVAEDINRAIGGGPGGWLEDMLSVSPEGRKNLGMFEHFMTMPISQMIDHVADSFTGVDDEVKKATNSTKLAEQSFKNLAKEAAVNVAPELSKEDVTALEKLQGELFPIKQLYKDAADARQLLDRAVAAGVVTDSQSVEMNQRISQALRKDIKDAKEDTDANKKLAETKKAIRASFTEASTAIARAQGDYHGVNEAVIELARSQGILKTEVSAGTGHWTMLADGTHKYEAAVTALSPRLAELNQRIKEAKGWEAAHKAISESRTDLQNYRIEADRLNGLLPKMTTLLGSNSAAQEVVRRILLATPWGQKRAEVEANQAAVSRLTTSFHLLGLTAPQLQKVRDTLANMKLSGGELTTGEVEKLQSIINKFKELARERGGTIAAGQIDELNRALNKLSVSPKQMEAARNVIRGNRTELQQYQGQAQRLTSLLPALTARLHDQGRAHNQIAMALRNSSMGQQIQQMRIEAMTAGQVAQKLRDLGISAKQAAQAKQLLGGRGKFVSPQEAQNVQAVIHKLRDLAHMKGILSPLQLKIQVNRAIHSLDDTKRHGTQMAKDIQSECQSMGSTVADSFAEMALTGKFSFHDMAQSIISDIVRILAYQALIAPLFGGGLGGGGGLFFAKGGAFKNGQQLKKYARGGVINKPTVFPMKRGMGLMGEAGEEGVLPLRRAANGDLGVTAVGAGGSFEGKIVIQNFSSHPQTAETQQRGPDMFVIFRDRIARDIDKGGPVGQAVSRTTGTSRPTMT